MRGFMLAFGLSLFGAGSQVVSAASADADTDTAVGRSEQDRSEEQTGPIEVKIDHVTIAGSDLSRMQEAFASLGLKSEYGGAHANGITHMALVGFDDGSYIELVSTVKPGETNVPIWKKFILEDGGPCGWAASSKDVGSEVKRVSALGVPVQGPFPGGRQRPDGLQAKWKLAFLGDQPVGAVLPFLIEDVTPRENRVKPAAGVMGGELTGVATVVIGLNELGGPIETFRRIYGWPAPKVLEDAQFGAKLAHFEGAPVVLEAPLEDSGWLATRVAHFGEAPVAFLLIARNFERACKQFDVEPPSAWLGRRVAWFDAAKLNGARLGLSDG